ETCSPTGIDSASIQIGFLNGPVSGRYVIRGEAEGSQFSEVFEMEEELVIPVPPGTYRVEIMDENGCTNPDSTQYTLGPATTAELSIPSQASSCSAFNFAPITSQELIFTLVDANGNRSSPETDGSFTITSEGTYTVRGEGADPSANICLTEKTINVMLLEPIDFELITPEPRCEGPYVYEVDLGSVDPSTVAIQW